MVSATAVTSGSVLPVPIPIVSPWMFNCVGGAVVGVADGVLLAAGETFGALWRMPAAGWLLLEWRNKTKAATVPPAARSTTSPATSSRRELGGRGTGQYLGRRGPSLIRDGPARRGRDDGVALTVTWWRLGFLQDAASFGSRVVSAVCRSSLPAVSRPGMPTGAAEPCSLFQLMAALATKPTKPPHGCLPIR